MAANQLAPNLVADLQQAVANPDRSAYLSWLANRSTPSDAEQLAMNLRAYADRPQTPNLPVYAQDAFDNQQAPRNNAANAGPVKAGLRHALLGMLGNAMYSAGQAGLKAAGLPTDQERMLMNARLENEIAQMQGTQSETALRNLELQRRQQAMQSLQGGDIAGQIFGPLGELTPDEQATVNAAKMQAQQSGDLSPLYQGFHSIVSNRAINKRMAGSNITVDPATGKPVKQILSKGGQVLGQLDTAPASQFGNTEANLQLRAQQGDQQAKQALDALQARRLQLANARGESFAKARAENTPFATFDADGNVTTTTVADAIHNGLPSAQVWNSIYGPTGSTKTQGQAAGAVQQHIPASIVAIDRLAARGELGAVAGRINQWATEGYGGNDPDVSELVTTVGLLQSGAVRAHFGAKGGSQILDKFNNYLNMAQEPEAMKGSLKAIDNFLTTYKNVGTASPPKRNSATPNGNNPGWLQRAQRGQ